MVWALVVAGCGGGGSEGPNTNGECRNYCSSLCSAFGACNVESESASCNDDCNAEYRGQDCRDLIPPSQYTCSELEDIHACAEYCATFCERAPECGDFDGRLCSEGCGLLTPPICNASSVGARTCDQLKPEARFYEEVARARENGGEAGGFLSLSDVGLCRTASDCPAGAGCSVETNTCGNCTSNDECTRSDFQHFLCASGACMQVECVEDADCSVGICDASNECADCRSDADCKLSLRPACVVETQTCVQCLTDAHCAASVFSDIYPACDTQNQKCVACTRDEHCVNSSTGYHRCLSTSQSCVECLADGDCTSSSPHCTTDHYCSIF